VAFNKLTGRSQVLSALIITGLDISFITPHIVILKITYEINIA